MSDLPGPVVLNATVQYNLSLTDDLELLDVVTEDVVTVSTVIEELRYGVEEDGLDYLDRAIGEVEVTDVEVDTDPSDLESLDAGETHALAVARFLDGTIVTDDDPARRQAAKLGVEVTGSLGILVLAIEQDQITVDEADEKLARWINEGGYHSPIASITEIL